MKDTEESAGTQLTIFPPAKIVEGLFIAAFGETEDQERTNLTLIENKEWMDLPIAYQSGRRALLTISKGSVGDKVFAAAIRDWKQAELK